LHELLQASLRSKEFDIFALKSTLDLVLHRPQMQLDMWAAELGIEDVRAEVWEKASTGLFGFGEKWVGARPKGEAVLHNSTSRLALTGLHDIEESIWSPKWGMKGKVDASVQATLVTGKSNSRNKKETAEEGREETIPKPFEIKTGRAVGIMEHRAQTMLYTLLMEERYRTSTTIRTRCRTCSKALCFL
jgi:DNA replication ATP-dependent helicase Dna2